MPAYEFNGLRPVVHPTAYVHPSAVLIGDVWVAENCYVGPCASLRGDFGRVDLRAGCNVQDTCVMHAFPGKDVVVERNGHVGHGAVLHGCTVGEGALVGMNAVVMDDAIIGKDAFVGACAFVPAGTEVAPAHLAVGAPARILRELSEDERRWKHRGTEEYQELARLSSATQREVEPLTEDDRARPRLDFSDYQTKPKS
ncbi:MAG: transferase hexapeptide repeat family protein [Pseudomonadota bacterium]